MKLQEKQEAMRLRWLNQTSVTNESNPASSKRHKPASTYKEFRRKRPQRVMLYSAKKNAAKCGVPFALTDNDITIPEFCPVLGIRLQRGIGKPCYASPSLDRIVPRKGYVPGNVRVISFRANTLKQNATIEEMRLVLKDLERIHGNGD